MEEISQMSSKFRNSRAELALMIALVQEHPMTPNKLKDNITDALASEWQVIDLTTEPAGIDYCLKALDQAQNKPEVSR